MDELARILLSLVAVAQSALMLLIEFNRTHATHPDWPGHARFHLVWQNLTTVLLSVVTLVLLWAPALRETGFFLAAALLAAPLLGFLLALLGRSIYVGRLSDPNGVPPLSARFGSRIISVDGNLFAVVLGAITILTAVFLHVRRST